MRRGAHVAPGAHFCNFLADGLGEPSGATVGRREQQAQDTAQRKNTKYLLGSQQQHCVCDVWVEKHHRGTGRACVTEESANAKPKPKHEPSEGANGENGALHMRPPRERTNTL